MRSHHAPRALALASGLVAAGLCLTAVPQARADGDSGSAMKLTSAEAKKLAAHVTLDPNVRAEDTPGTKKDAASAPEASAPEVSASGSVSADPTTPVTVTPKGTLEGVRGMGATVPAGKNGDHYSVNSMGYVQLHAADGRTKWARTTSSFFTDWQVKPLQVWRTEPYPAQILMGYNAVSPFSPNSDSGYSTGDLTGDGVPDIAFTASVGIEDPRSFTSPGSDLNSGTFVTVLDGRSGATVWSKLYDYASMVKIVDGTLLIADAPRMGIDRNIPADATLTLTGLTFTSGSDGRLTPATSWTYDSKETRFANWGDLQDLGKGKVAVSWNLRKGDGVAARGRTLVLDAADGSVTWQTDSMLYNRQMRLDSGRRRIVAIEQSDATDAVHYEVAAYDLKTGHRTTLQGRDNVVPTALAVGDLGGKAGDEYAVAESSFDENFLVSANTVRVVNGDSADRLRWSHTVKRDDDDGDSAANTFGLSVAAGKLVSAGQDNDNFDVPENRGGTRYASLTVFSAKGAVAWQSKGVAGTAMYTDIYSDTAGTHVRVIDPGENIRTFKLANGKAEKVTPLQGDVSHAASADLDKDGKNDLIMGGSSNGLWAYSGPSMVNGAKPEKLWQATLPGAVHDIETGDVDGDGRPEIVVAADTATVVLNGKTGKTLATIDGGGQYIHTAELADLDGDGEQDILVPADALRAYHGDGHALWTYHAPEDAGDVQFADPSVNDGRVYASYASAGAVDLTDPVTSAVALDAKTGKARWSAAPKAPADATSAIRTLTPNEGVFASEEIPYADGHAVAYVWNVDAPLKVDGTTVITSQNVFEIRDGRTGEVVHTSMSGGLWTHTSFFAEDGALYEGGVASFRRFRANGDDTVQGVFPTSHGGGFLTGPGGRRLLAAGTEGGLYLWDPSILESDDTWAPEVGKSPTLMGARNLFTGDLDGDGVDEVVSLNNDLGGYDRLVGLFGGGVYSDDHAIHQVTAYKLS
ncbi:VCBS repeat-containing protein [Streptomyces sp. SID5785]|uniref:FG-GAP repeat domain-containing protein n=1 Tax=Streptomyces sp. SID5785 TaxID=2690309 RepID=UPI001361C2FF|nr:VCBS repeat-containing protein [Streptomyces sp. SID5785]MZD03898.1 VCBS repeat-containing protein [Streptomyces sp. SID5785]